MLKHFKQGYETIADRIADWRVINKNELIRSYISNEASPILAEAYLAAILCRYWFKIGKFYASSKNSATIEDCYDWLVHGVLYALRHRKWMDPRSPMYQDSNGPDKVMNRCIASSRLIYFQASNSGVRKANHATNSFERLVEDIGETFIPSAPDESPLFNCANQLIDEAFDKHDYFLSFMIDMIAYQDSFEKDKESNSNIFSLRKLAGQFLRIGEEYGNYFSRTFKKEKNKVADGIKYCQSMSRVRIRTAIKRNLALLAQNTQLIEDMKCF